MQHDPIVITRAARTPIGSFQGALAPVSAPDLGAAAVAAAIERSAVSAESIEEVVMGCVLPAGLRQALPASGARGGSAHEHPVHHHKQNVWVRHEGCHAGARPYPGWQWPNPGVGRS